MSSLGHLFEQHYYAESNACIKKLTNDFSTVEGQWAGLKTGHRMDAWEDLWDGLYGRALGAYTGPIPCLNNRLGRLNYCRLMH